MYFVTYYTCLTYEALRTDRDEAYLMSFHIFTQEQQYQMYDPLKANV